MNYIRRILRQNVFAKKLYNEVKDIGQDYSIPEITSVIINKSRYDNDLRLNLLLPSVNKEHAFGGITTAYQFFESLRKAVGCDVRIISLDAKINKHDSILSEDYKIITSDRDDIVTKCQAISFEDRFGKSLPVSSKDIFVATAWWTAYNAIKILKQQSSIYGNEMNSFIYLIQDFEPGFYPWSSRFLLADSTYRHPDKTIAIFNSNELRDYFISNNYTFKASYVFNPIFNVNIKRILHSESRKMKKRKIILLYGRPNVPRNAFELIVAGIKEWANLYPDAKSWKILSAGEKHADIDCGNGVSIRSLGKLSIDDYTNLLLDTYLGISLMVSPHPSYPPLEMSVFGIKTITNTFLNKNLATSYEHIYNLNGNTPDQLACLMCKLCSEFKENDITYISENDFYKSEDAFKSIIRELIKILNS